MKPTAERILDAAEDLFARKGYTATSMGEVASAVGIRSPSLYNHFRNKEALYQAVLDRLLEKFLRPTRETYRQDDLTLDTILDWQRELIKVHVENPNLARLLQHVALSGGPEARRFMENLYKPLTDIHDPENYTELMPPKLRERPDLVPWVLMALNNLIMSYVTMAPLYQDMIGDQPFGEQGAENQAYVLNILTRALFNYSGED